MASEKQIGYIMSLMRSNSELYASTGVVTLQMVNMGLATRKELGHTLASWAGNLDKSDASWVINKLTEQKAA